MTDYIDWPGQRHTYRYWFLSSPVTSKNIQSVAGNYMFVKPTNNGWIPIYVGIAEDLSERLPNHERWQEALKHGATHIIAHKNLNATARNAEEADLISYWQPPLNVQLRKLRTGLGY